MSTYYEFYAAVEKDGKIEAREKENANNTGLTKIATTFILG